MGTCSVCGRQRGEPLDSMCDWCMKMAVDVTLDQAA